MFFPSNFLRLLPLAALIAAGASFSSCASEARTGSTGPVRLGVGSGKTSIVWRESAYRRASSARKAGDPAPVQGSRYLALKVDATTAASGEDAVKDAAYCLKCHGPFDKLAERTKDYVTEWDEQANPHVYEPHDSRTIIECAECHDPHPLPFKPSADARVPDVKFCYSCHHAETLVNCNQCHKE